VDKVRVRYSQPLEVDVDLETGRVLGVRAAGVLTPDRTKLPVILDERFDWLCQGPDSLAEQAFAAADGQILTFSSDAATLQIEVVPVDEPAHV
jgi:hypothetical protein